MLWWVVPEAVRRRRPCTGDPRIGSEAAGRGAAIVFVGERGIADGRIAAASAVGSHGIAPLQHGFWSSFRELGDRGDRSYPGGRRGRHWRMWSRTRWRRRTGARTCSSGADGRLGEYLAVREQAPRTVSPAPRRAQRPFSGLSGGISGILRAAGSPESDERRFPRGKGRRKAAARQRVPPSPRSEGSRSPSSPARLAITRPRRLPATPWDAVPGGGARSSVSAASPVLAEPRLGG